MSQREDGGCGPDVWLVLVMVMGNRDQASAERSTYSVGNMRRVNVVQHLMREGGRKA